MSKSCVFSDSMCSRTICSRFSRRSTRAIIVRIMSTREQPSTSELVAAWFEGDWDVDRFTWFADQVWHPEIEWRAIEGAPDDVGPIHGVERLARYYGEWAELFDD